MKAPSPIGLPVLSCFLIVSAMPVSRVFTRKVLQSSFTIANKGSGFTDGKTQPIPIGGYSDHVVGHQAVAPYVNGIFSAPVRHQIDVRTVVPIGEKCLLPAVAALDYVMRIVGDNDPCDSGHGLDYRRSCRIGSRNKYGVP